MSEPQDRKKQIDSFDELLARYERDAAARAQQQEEETRRRALERREVALAVSQPQYNSDAIDALTQLVVDILSCSSQQARDALTKSEYNVPNAMTLLYDAM